jgi:hypothetical protein
MASVADADDIAKLIRRAALPAVRQEVTELPRRHRWQTRQHLLQVRPRLDA